jgi:CHAT domain-containing protein
MTGFFASMTQAPPAGLAGALRRSQLALLDEPATAHPFYWAAFGIIGDGAAPDRTAAAQPGDEPSGGRI